MCHSDTCREGEWFSPARDIQNRKQAGHVIHVDELDLVIEIFLAVRQQAWQALAFPAHLGGAFSFATRNSAKSSEQVVLHARTGENVRPENVRAAAAQRGSTLLNYVIGLTLVNRVGKGMGFENEFLCDRAWQVRAIGRDAAGE